MNLERVTFEVYIHPMKCKFEVINLQNYFSLQSLVAKNKKGITLELKCLKGINSSLWDYDRIIARLMFINANLMKRTTKLQVVAQV